MGKKTSGTPPDVVEAFASAVITEDMLALCLKDVGVPEPWLFANLVELTQAYIDGRLARYQPAPMLPITLYSVWTRIHHAGHVWDKHFRHNDS